MYSFKHTEDLGKIEELPSLQSQVEAVRLQDKIGKQKFHEDMKKVFEPVTKTLENTSQDITKITSETFIKNNKTILALNEKLLELLNEKGF